MDPKEIESSRDVLRESVPVGANRIGPSPKPQSKILVIDDDPVTVKALTAVLNRKGYSVCSAINGSEAIRVVREENPDMLLVDVSLAPDPDYVDTVLWDGFQTTRWLRHISAKKIPAIMMSATDKAEYKKYAAMIGAETFLTKPLSDAILYRSIESALARPTPSGFASL